VLFFHKNKVLDWTSFFQLRATLSRCASPPPVLSQGVPGAPLKLWEPQARPPALSSGSGAYGTISVCGEQLTGSVAGWPGQGLSCFLHLPSTLSLPALFCVKVDINFSGMGLGKREFLWNQNSIEVVL